MTYNKTSFCKGIFCRKSDRRYKCVDCAKSLCKVCSTISVKDQKIRCPDCYIKSISPDWNELNAEFEDMLIKLGLIKNEKKYDIKKEKKVLSQNSKMVSIKRKTVRTV